MADKIIASDVIESDKIVEEIGRVDKALVSVLTTMKGVSNQSLSFKTQSEGNATLQKRVALEGKAGALIKERTRLETALTREQAKRTQAARVVNQNLQKERVAVSALNREAKEAAILTSKYTGAYQKLNLQRSQASKTLRDLVASEKASNEELEKAQANFDKLDAKVKKADSAVRDSTKNVGNYKSAFAGIKDVLTGLVGAFGIIEGLRLGISFTKDAIEMAKQAKGVEFAFERLGESGENAFNRVKAATRGALSDIDIKTAINEFDQFGLSVERVDTLFEFLAVSAAQTGKSVDELKSSLVEGLSKESKLRIDNLGISAGELNDELAKTPDFVDAVANIAERKLVNAGSILDDAGNSTEALNASVNNLTVSFGKLFENLKFFEVLIPFIDDYNNKLRLSGLYGSVVDKNLQEIEEKILGNETAYARLSATLLGSFSSAGRRINKLIVEEIDKRQEVIDKINEQQRAYVALNGSLAPLNKTQKEVVKGFNLKSPLRSVSFLNTEIDRLSDKLQEVSNRDEALEIQNSIEALEKEKEAILGSSQARETSSKIIEGTISYYEKLISTEKDFQTNEALTAEQIQNSNFKILEYQESIDKLINVKEKLNKVDAFSIGDSDSIQKDFDKITKPFEDAGFDASFDLDTSSAISELERYNEARKNGEEAYTKFLADQKDEQAEIVRGLFREFENLYGIDASAFSNLLDSKKNDFESYADAAGELNTLIFNFSEQKRQQDYEDAQNTLDKVLDDQTKSDEQKLAAQIEFDRKEYEIRRKSFEAQKAASITQIAIDTAVAIVKATAQTGVTAPLFIPAIVALGAIQAGIVASQKPPAFYKGTENAPEGWAWTDEKGAEIHTDKYGNIKDYGSDGGARLKWLESGDKIFTATKTKEVLNNTIYKGHEERLAYKSNSSINDNRLYNEVSQLRREMARYANKPNNFNVTAVVKQPITKY